MQSGSETSWETEKADSTCIFCMPEGVTPYILKETSSFRIIADHAPLVEGHLLVMPKEHYACYGTVPAELDEELFTVKREVQCFFERYYAPTVFWEHGVFHQTVFHAHLHSFPFGEIEYTGTEALHDEVVSSQDDIRTWYRTHGEYFYLEDNGHAFLFKPEMERYLQVVRSVLWSGMTARNGHKTWRSVEQRRQEGKASIEALAANWRAFQQHEADTY